MTSKGMRIKADLIKRFTTKKILILGFGREGKSTLHLLNQLDVDLDISIMDQNSQQVHDYVEDIKWTQKYEIKIIDSSSYLQGLNVYDVIFKTPGIAGYLMEDVDEGKILSQSQLFMEYMAERTIGVTGTKGKSTTSSLIAYILEKLGYKVQLVGNIGRPAVDLLMDVEDDTYYVYELSSFQTEFLRVAPKIGIILNLFEEHLNNYRDLDAYHESKMQLFKAPYVKRGRRLVAYGSDNERLKHKVEDLKIKRSMVENTSCHWSAFGKLSGGKDKEEVMDIEDGIYLQSDDQMIVRVQKGQKTQLASGDFNRHLLGEHNLINMLVVFDILTFMQEEKMILPIQEEMNTIIGLLSEFKGLEHRLQYVGCVGGIHFFDDSISTIPQACLSAVGAIDNISTLLIGGYDRGIDYKGLAEELSQMPLQVICLPDTGHKVMSYIESKEKRQRFHAVETMEEAVELAFKITPAAYSCLLSPAASSYNVYKNFEERGNHYQMLIKEKRGRKKMRKLSKYIDHTLLKPDASKEAVDKICQEAITYDFASVCVNQYRTKQVAKALEGSDVKVCTVVGFPLGAVSKEVKAFETRQAIADGADEIDMVINIGAMKDGDFQVVLEDIQAVVEAAQGKVVKVIIETCLLSDPEKVKACELALEAKADFVKTSTGFSLAGATVESVRLMKDTVKDKALVKASGGIRSYEDAMAMIEAGADRIGASAGIAIVSHEDAGQGNY